MSEAGAEDFKGPSVLEQVEHQVRAYVGELNDSRSVALYEKLPRGKMLRSKLILAIAGERNPEEAVRLCAIIEMIHAASLLHDDVIDEADTRRGLTSINAAFGNKSAIMFGDILYSKAYFELTGFDPDISCKVSNAVLLLSIGELLDVDFCNAFQGDETLYMDMIYKKTASLIEASAYCAAKIAGLDADAYGHYGRSLGLAFQIVDDLLDVTMTSEQLGKPAMSDFAEGKSTLPYIRLHDVMDANDRSQLQSLFGVVPSEEHITWIKTAFKQHGIIQSCSGTAKALGYEGLSAIGTEIPKLDEIMRAMIEREF